MRVPSCRALRLSLWVLCASVHFMPFKTEMMMNLNCYVMMKYLFNYYVFKFVMCF